MTALSGTFITFRGMDRNISPEIPERCGICTTNPAVFEFRRRSEGNPPTAETGHCCTACAFHMLVELAEEEIEWLALAGT